MIGDAVHGANLVDIVHGGGLPEVGDPSEDFIEATKLHRDSMGWEAPGVRMLESVPEMGAVVARAGRDYASLPGVDLPDPDPISAPLVRVLRDRRSAPAIADQTISLRSVATVLRTAWEPVGPSGAVHGSQPRRPSPSAGALQPLDLWIVVRDVTGLEPGLHYVQMNHTGQARTIHVGAVDLDAFAEASLQPEITGAAPVSIVVSAMPWRSRFKYGHRAVRFALIEAGHVVQNLQLIATGLGLASRPLGGFVDDEINALLGFDGVNEVGLYVVPVGSPVVHTSEDS